MSIQQASSSVVVRINKLGTTLPSFPKHTIFKVHKMLRRENEMAYEPNIVAIGPYHRGKDHLRVMEDLKLRWFKSINFLEQPGEIDATEFVDKALKMMAPKARLRYSESTANVNEDAFEEMLLLDSCFIIQFMCGCLGYNYNTTSDPSLQDWVVNSSTRDVLLFENQIPLFVLQELFFMIELPGVPFLDFDALALNFLTRFLENEFGLSLEENQLSSIHGNHIEIEHILGLLHYILRSIAIIDDSTNQLLTWTAKTVKNLQLCKPRGFRFINNQLRRCRWLCRLFHKKDGSKKCDKLKYGSIPSATLLHTAGVKFESKKVDGNNPFNPFKISFKNGAIRIHTFTVDDGTESLYRNLIAYEQYNQEASIRYVCIHVMLMDCLIDSADDVALLRHSKIIGNSLGDDEAVSRVFNKLGNQVCLDISNSIHHVKLFNEVNAYYEKRRYKWMATLRRDYFNSPWALFSFLAAFLLLLLTFTQTVFSILGGV